jgi:hypothetical protein
MEFCLWLLVVGNTEKVKGEKLQLYSARLTPAHYNTGLDPSCSVPFHPDSLHVMTTHRQTSKQSH